MLIFTFICSVFTGGISSPFLVFIIPVPLLTAVAFGKKPAIITAIFSIATALVLAFISLAHLGFSTLESNSYIMNILDFIVSFLVLIQLSSIGISIFQNIRKAGDQIEEDAQNRKDLLDSLEDGIFFIEKDGFISREHSKAMRTMFPDFSNYGNIKDFYYRYKQISAENSKVILDLLWEDNPGFSDFNMNVRMLPKNITVEKNEDKKYYSLNYKPLYGEQKKLDRVLVSTKDITLEVEQEKKIENQIERNERISKAASDTEGFKQFLEENNSLFKKVETFSHSGFDAAEPKRYIHTLKGNLALFCFKKLADMIHNVEDLIEQNKTEQSVQEWNKVNDLWAKQTNDLVNNLNLNRLDNFFPVIREKLNTLHNWASRDGNAALSDKVWDLYCLPLDDLFNKYKDFCKQLNLKNPSKKVDIIVDKDSDDLAHSEIAMFDQAIIHIIKNSVDHGIESCDQRIKLGKNEFGTITIKGIRSLANSAIALTITDDGGGINYENLGIKAVKSGKWTHEQLAKSSKQDKINLIYESGVSTAEEVSDLSGRGVGMDAVKSHLESQGGSINVETEINKGTSFHLSLPLSNLSKAA